MNKADRKLVLQGLDLLWRLPARGLHDEHLMLVSRLTDYIGAPGPETRPKARERLIEGIETCAQAIQAWNNRDSRP